MFTTKTKELPSTPQPKDEDSDDSMERALKAPSTKTVRSGRSLFRQTSGQQMYLSVDTNGSVTSLDAPQSDAEDERKGNQKSVTNSDNERESLLTSSGHKTTLQRNSSVRAANAPEIRITKDSPRSRIHKPAKLEIPDQLRPGRKKLPARGSTIQDKDDDHNSSNLITDDDLPLREISLNAENQNTQSTTTALQQTKIFKRLSALSGGPKPRDKSKLRQLSDQLDGQEVTHENVEDFTRHSKLRSSAHTNSNKFEPQSNSITLLPLRTGTKRLKRKSSDATNYSESIPDSPESNQAYLALLEQIGIERVFINPELDVVNRVCLEYTALCAKTEERWSLIKKHVSHFSRVYDAMTLRMESTSTPIIDTAPSVSTPVILTMLLLDRFRIRSNESVDLESQVPLLSHNHKMGMIKFRTIIRQCFDRRAFFFRNVDISRHGLDDLA